MYRYQYLYLQKLQLHFDHCCLTFFFFVINFFISPYLRRIFFSVDYLRGSSEDPKLTCPILLRQYSCPVDFLICWKKFILVLTNIFSFNIFAIGLFLFCIKLKVLKFSLIALFCDIIGLITVCCKNK